MMKPAGEMREILLKLADAVISNVTDCILHSDDFDKIVMEKSRDVTRKLDMVAEDTLEAYLLEHDLSARIISEELGDRVFPSGEDPAFTLVFDPVDGSTNASRGIPFFCTSIAYAPKVKDVGFDDITIGIVKTAYGRTYHAVRGEGAFLDDKKIDVGHIERDRRKKQIFCIYSYGVNQLPHGILEFGGRNIIRVLGSIAIEMCLLAQGALDGIIEVRDVMNGYDIMASSLILKEAGGILTDTAGEPIRALADVKGISFVGARDEGTHDQILRILKG
ncbi:inositol-1-monophosphatase [Methanosarcinales archaeon]|nr:MAG: inositol-1-monophosphatase [Methanosarcinales archaeon]